MLRIQRPTIQTNVRTIATQLDVALGAVVADVAEGLELPQPKLIAVAAVGFDVIADRRRRRQAARQA